MTALEEARDFPEESWAFFVSRVGEDSYLISSGGEFSLVDSPTLIYLLRKLLEGQT